MSTDKVNDMVIRGLSSALYEKEKRISKLENFIEGWYDTVKDLCESCEDTSFETYQEEMKELGLWE